MPPGYSRPIPVFEGETAISLQATQRVFGVHHLSQVVIEVRAPLGVNDGILVVDFVPEFDFPFDADGDIFYTLDISGDALTGPFSRHYSYPGNGSYVRYRITEIVAGGATPGIYVWHNGYSNM